VKTGPTVRDTNNYHLWNSYFPTCRISPESPPPRQQTSPNIPTGIPGYLELGTIANIDVFLSGDGLIAGRKPSRAAGLIVTVLEEFISPSNSQEFRMAWKATGWARWQLCSERVMQFVEADGGGTEYTCWETFGGLLAPTVRRTVGKVLVERMRDNARDARVFMESRMAGAMVGGMLSGKEEEIVVGMEVEVQGELKARENIKDRTRQKGVERRQRILARRARARLRMRRKTV
jgi:hypothetical protein